MGPDILISKPAISMSAPDIDETDVEAVTEVLRSGRLAEEFEHRIAEYAGVPHAVAVSSGTAALHLIFKGLGCGPGDEVLVPSFTFAASVNAILYVGASPVFADIEPEQYTLDPEDTARRVTGRTRAIMAVDVFGHPVEWDALSTSAEHHGLSLIDDSCEDRTRTPRPHRSPRFRLPRYSAPSEQADDDRRGWGQRDPRRTTRPARA